jgi:L-lactate dehydrogenase complex protein LldE
MYVDLFVPCFIDQIYPQTAFNAVKLLEKAGVEVKYNPNQTCCGQPAFNAGHWKEARAVGEKFIHDFNVDRYIVAPSGSCVGYVKNYFDKLFADSSLHNDFKQIQGNLFELTDFLVNVLHFTDFKAELHGKATYHDGCAALRECHIKNEPRELLKKVKGLELIEMQAPETCCGFGGTFSIKYEAISTGMGDMKMQDALQTGADYLISTEHSCLMHLNGLIQQQSKPIKVMHIADVLTSGW